MNRYIYMTDVTQSILQACGPHRLEFSAGELQQLDSAHPLETEGAPISEQRQNAGYTQMVGLTTLVGYAIDIMPETAQQFG